MLYFATLEEIDVLASCKFNWKTFFATLKYKLCTYDVDIYNYIKKELVSQARVEIRSLEIARVSNRVKTGLYMLPAHFSQYRLVQFITKFSTCKM